MEEENRKILEFCHLQQEREAERVQKAKEEEEKKSQLYAKVRKRRRERRSSIICPYSFLKRFQRYKEKWKRWKCKREWGVRKREDFDM